MPSPAPSAPTPTSLWRQDLAVCALGLLALLAWDLAGADLAVVRLWGSPTGFAWRDHWLTRDLLHEGGRLAGWAVFALLLVNIWKPLPFARGVPRPVRIWWALAPLACVALIPLLKRASPVSCPWDLAEFGGSARYLSHWAWGQADGGGGGCFPSGHASTGFAFLSGWFALRLYAPRAARAWLAATLLAATAFGWAQLARGAHYPSHTLWTGWICLALLTALSALRPELRGRSPA